MLRSALSYAMGLTDGAYGLLAKALKPAEDVFFPDGFGNLSICAHARAEVEGRAREGVLYGDPVELRFMSEKGRVREAVFRSPLARFLPEESAEAHALVVEPAPGVTRRGVVVHMAATGDEGVRLRRYMVAEPLAARGFVSIILVIPMYGVRRPSGQVKYYPRTVAHMMMTSLACCVEGAHLLRWARAAYPGLPAGVCGMSYGGAMAGGTACLDLGPEPLAVCCFVGAPSPHVLVSGSLRPQVSFSGLGHDEDSLLRIFESIDICNTESRFWVRRFHPRKRVSVVALHAEHDRLVLPGEAQRFASAMEDLSCPARHRAYSFVGGHVSAFVFARTFYVPHVAEAFELLEEEEEEVEEEEAAVAEHEQGSEGGRVPGALAVDRAELRSF